MCLQALVDIFNAELDADTAERLRLPVVRQFGGLRINVPTRSRMAPTTINSTLKETHFNVVQIATRLGLAKSTVNRHLQRRPIR